MSIKENYKTKKLIYRNKAIEIQNYISNNNLSYGELLEIQQDLIKWGKKYGLTREFKENGLI